MLYILSQFASTIISILQFLYNTVTSLIDFIAHIPDYLLFINQSMNLLPSILIPFALASIGIYVFLFTVGKD